jgi:hypothetical protein
MRVWLRNIRTVHHRIMANFLRKRGWVVFYLEERARHCDNECCWLKLYQQGKGGWEWTIVTIK